MTQEQKAALTDEVEAMMHASDTIGNVGRAIEAENRDASAVHDLVAARNHLALAIRFTQKAANLSA